MPTDGNEFTLGLFDQTALSGWNAQALQAALTNDHADPPEDADADTVSAPPRSSAVFRGTNFRLVGERDLARGWPARARDNIAAIQLSKELEQTGRIPTREEQAQLLRFTGFGATELAQNCFRRPGEDGFRPGWEEIGTALEAAVAPAEYAALQRATQYAHYTPETIIRALWRAAERLGFCGGRVLEPGMGTGLFFALLPEALCPRCRLTGIEYDPVTARIARLVHPEARVRCEDYARSPLGGGFDLVIGNPPFADRVVRADPMTRALRLRLHDYFIARSIARLRPGGIALFVTSTGTMDKATTTAREHIAGMADLVGAVRLPEGSMRAERRHRRRDRRAGVSAARRGPAARPARHGSTLPRCHARRPRTMATRRVGSPDSPGEPLLCGAPGDGAGRARAAPRHLWPRSHLYLPGPGGRRRTSKACWPKRSTVCPPALSPHPPALTDDSDDDTVSIQAGTAADGATIKEGSYLTGDGGPADADREGHTAPVAIRDGKGGEGITPRAARIIRGLLPIRDAVRDVLRAQAADQPWREPQVRLRIAYSGFVRSFGPINRTEISTLSDPETGDERETHRRPNLAPFADDPDCWLVASIEDYDLESGLARMGPIFRERVIAPPPRRRSPPRPMRSPSRSTRPATSMPITWPSCSTAIPTQPSPSSARPSSATRQPKPGRPTTRISPARSAPSWRSPWRPPTRDPQYARNVAALQRVQPEDLRPSDITARLGAPWIPAADIEAFAAAVMRTRTRVWHTVETATWTVEISPFVGTAAGTSEWGTSRRNAGWLLHDALNSAHAADLRHRDRGRRREARAQQRGDRGREGKARPHQAGVRGLGMDRCRTAPTGWHASTTTSSTTWCRAGSTAGT